MTGYLLSGSYQKTDKAENVRNAEAGLALGVRNESMKSSLWQWPWVSITVSCLESSKPGICKRPKVAGRTCLLVSWPFGTPGTSAKLQGRHFFKSLVPHLCFRSLHWLSDDVFMSLKASSIHIAPLVDKGFLLWYHYPAYWTKTFISSWTSFLASYWKNSNDLIKHILSK